MFFLILKNVVIAREKIHTTRRARAIDILFFSGEAMLRDADRDNECVAFNHPRLRAARS